MAIEFSLYMYKKDRAVDPDEVEAALLKHLPLESDVGKGDLFGKGVYVTVRAMDLEEAQEDGFANPGVCVGFRMIKEEMDDFYPMMYTIVDWLLRNFDVEAQFHNRDDLGPVKLFKVNGRLVLVNPSYWDPTIRNLITPPYECRKADRGFEFCIHASDAVTRAGVLTAMLAKLPVKPHPDPRWGGDIAGQGFEAFVKNQALDPSRAASTGSPAGEVVMLSFYINVFQYDDAVERMLGVVRWLLDTYPGDASLQWSSEKPLLQRIGDRLILGDEPDFWTPQRKALFSP